MSNNWTYSSLLCFFKKLPLCFHWGNSAKNMGMFRNHISSEMARELIATYQTMYHLWFLEYQRVLPQLRVHLSRHHLHHRSQHRLTEIQYQITEVWKLQYHKEVEVRMKSFGETRCKPKTKIEIRNWRKYKEKIAWIACLATGIQREFGRWKYFNRAFGKPRAGKSRHFPSLLMNYQWSREQKGNRFRVSRVYLRTFRRIRIVISAWRPQIIRTSCRRRGHAVMPRAENFFDWITADHKILSEESESRNNHRNAVVVQDLAIQWIQSFSCETKASQETQKSLMKFPEPTRQPKVIYTDNSLEFGKSCEELS